MSKSRKIKILFDANPLAISGKSGVGNYTYRLIAALAKNYPDDLVLIGHYYDFLGRKNPHDLPQAINIKYRQSKLLPGKVFNGLRRHLGIEVPLEVLARRRGDVLLFPNFVLSPSLYKTPRMVTVHDLYFLEHPEHINSNNLDFLQKFVPRSIAAADSILAVSEFTKAQIIKKFDVAASKIVVTPIPPEKPTKMSPDEVKKALSDMSISKDFILYVGNIEPRKNLVKLIEAYQKLPGDIKKDVCLVLAGGKGWKDEEEVAAIDKALKDGFNIILPGYVSDEQKAALYQGAQLLALPSHYEGFGMQILEAMSYGVPVAVSNIPVFHEVAGPAAVYFDKDSADSIASAIEKALSDESLRRNLIQNGFANLERYNWDEVAKSVYEKMKELANG